MGHKPLPPWLQAPNCFEGISFWGVEGMVGGWDGTWEPVPSLGGGESTGCVCQVSLLTRRKQLGQETRYKRGDLQESRRVGWRGLHQRKVCRSHSVPWSNLRDMVTGTVSAPYPPPPLFGQGQPSLASGRGCGNASTRRDMAYTLGLLTSRGLVPFLEKAQHISWTPAISSGSTNPTPQQITGTQLLSA